MPDWYRTHDLSPEAYSDDEYRSWAQDNGLYVDAAGNVDYGPPEAAAERAEETHGLFEHSRPPRKEAGDGH